VTRIDAPVQDGRDFVIGEESGPCRSLRSRGAGAAQAAYLSHTAATRVGSSCRPWRFTSLTTKPVLGTDFLCRDYIPAPVTVPSGGSFVLTLFIFKAPNYVLARTLTERVV